MIGPGTNDLKGGHPMSTIISVEEAQTKLKELIDKLAPGEEVILTENQRPVAKLIGERHTRPLRPAPGLGKGSVLYMAPDFDEPMEEFQEYME
jgi:antitoxin (DNA-binding transcriptional repressor) of toxin-antitoxin stability system